MDFYYNDLYPNQGFYNTRMQTIPEASDREALLEEDKKANVKAKTNPKDNKKIFFALALFLIIAVVLGVLK